MANAETIADYNNNPGNLRPPRGVTYEGQIDVDDRGFAIFENKEYGRRALINDINAKIKTGRDNPEKFINMYAPRGDENSEEARNNYKKFIAKSLGLSDVNEAFPENSAEKIADAITKFEGGTWMKPERREEPAKPPAVQETQAPSSGEQIPSDEGERIQPVMSRDIPGVEEAIKPALGLTGAAIGFGTAAPIESAKKIAPVIRGISNTAISAVKGQQPDPSLVRTRFGLQRYLDSQLTPEIRMSLSELEKVTGGQKIRTMSEVQNALKAIQKVEEKKITKPMVRMVRPGVFEQTGRFVPRTIPGSPGIDLSKYEVPPQGPVKAAISREVSAGKELAKAALPSIAKVGVGALGGLNAAITGYETSELYKKIEDMRRQGIEPTLQEKARLAAKGAATVGGGLSMLPFGITQIGGGALQAPELAWSLYDLGSEAYRRIEDRMSQMTPEEIEGGLGRMHQNVYP